MPRPQCTFSDDEIISPSGWGRSVLPFLYDQEGEDEAIDVIGHGDLLHVEVLPER